MENEYTKALAEKDAEIAQLRDALKDLLEASHHTSEMEYLGDDDPWDKAVGVLDALKEE